MEDRHALLNNSLDALDRLFDCEAGIADVGAILYATGHAIRPSSLSPLFLDAAASLERIHLARLTAEEERESALRSTNQLRVALAEALEKTKDVVHAPPRI
jgi:hypothetical protein